MAKIVSLICILSLLLFLTLSGDVIARSDPKPSDVAPVKVQRKGDEVEREGCEGGEIEDECLMRRTLEAHLDYIYTQKQKQP